jgi:hypothetical protein
VWISEARLRVCCGYYRRYAALQSNTRIGQGSKFSRNRDYVELPRHTNVEVLGVPEVLDVLFKIIAKQWLENSPLSPKQLTKCSIGNLWRPAMHEREDEEGKDLDAQIRPRSILDFSMLEA